MKLIKLQNGHVTKVDDEDYELLNKFNWSAHKDRSGNLYVKREQYVGKRYNIKRKYKEIHMARQLLNLYKFNGIFADHIDGDTLNNQKSNLRCATRSQNGVNRRPKSKNKTSKYLGVSLNKIKRKNGKIDLYWDARTKFNGKTYCKKFKTEIEAALYYNKISLELHKEYANLNIILI